MKNFVFFFFLLFSLGLNFSSNAQEIECVVTIDNQQATDINKNLLDELKQTIQNFINNRRWTTDNFEPFERIKMNLIITLNKGATNGVYPSRATIQIVRPVYGTTYESVVFTFLDTDFDFEYTVGQQMQFNENSFDSNLTSLLSFYVYVALAMDYDSFGKLGGSPWVEKAFNIAGVAQQNTSKGWELNNFSNKWGLISSLNNVQFVPFRESLYAYHYEAMDIYLKNREAARTKILETLKTIQTVQNFSPTSIVIKSFFLAKYTELISIYSGAPQAMKSEVVALLQKMDPANSNKYSAIMTAR